MPTPQFDINNVLKRAMSVDVSTTFQPYSGVEIIVSDTSTIVWPTDDAERNAGRVLTIYNPWGTLAQAQNILSSLRGYTYQPYNAQGALLDPAAEIGDGVSVNDVYGGAYKISRKFSSLMAADVSAPQSEEIDHEYPYESSQNREVQRRFSALESEFRIASDEISAKVSQTGGDSSTFGWSLTSDGFVLTSDNKTVFKVDSNGAAIYGGIQAIRGYIGTSAKGFSISESSISNGLTGLSDTQHTGVYIGTDGIKVSSGTSAFMAQSNGNVKGHNMTLTGTLYFVDGNGNTKSMNANSLRAGAQSAYTNGSTWTTGSGYGYDFNNATQPNTASYPSRFKCGVLTAVNGASISSYFELFGKQIGTTTIKDYNGVSRNVLSWQ